MYFSWLEYHPDKVRVGGSSPPMDTMEMCQSGLLCFPAKEVVVVKGPVGSNPAISAKYRGLSEKN